MDVEKEINRSGRGAELALKAVFNAAGAGLMDVFSSRSSWLIAGTGLGLYAGLFWIRNQWGDVPGTTTLGQLAELVDNLMWVLGILLPFLVTDVLTTRADGLGRPALLGRTALLGRSALLGRYLAVLAVSLGLAAVMLAVALLANLAFPRLESQFPPADSLLTIAWWARFAVPAAILVGSVCFCLGGFFPRFTLAPKLAVCAAWIWLALPPDPADLSWRVYWNPTGAGLITQVMAQYQAAVQRQIQTTAGIPSIPGVLLRLQQAAPVLSPWTGPFLALAGVGLLLGLAGVFYFGQGKESG